MRERASDVRGTATEEAHCERLDKADALRRRIVELQHRMTAEGPADSARAAPSADNRGGRAAAPSMRRALGRALSTEHIASSERFFLDSTNLLDVKKINEHIGKSANYILLLTRWVLERPVVLVELAAAFSMGKKICVLMIEFPANDKCARAAFDHAPHAPPPSV